MPSIPSRAPATASLVGTSDGGLVQIAATATPGTQLYEVQASGTARDHVKIYAANNSGAAVDLTIEVMGVTSADQIVVTVPSKDGLHLVAELWVRNVTEGSKATIAAFAGTTNVINCHVVAQAER